MTEEKLKKEIFDILNRFPKNTNFYSERAKRTMAESIAKRINEILKEKK